MEVFAIAAAAFLVIIVLLGVKRVPQGSEYTVERFGRYTKTLRPGLNPIMPVFDQIGAKLNMMEQVLDVPSQEVITKDNVTVRVNAVAYFRVVDPEASVVKVLDHIRATSQISQTTVRNVLGQSELDELLTRQLDHAEDAEARAGLFFRLGQLRADKLEDPMRAVEAYREHQDMIELVLLDMVMPGMGGGETFHALRKIDPEAKVLISSGRTGLDGVRELLSAGAHGFLQKPYDAGALGEAVAAAAAPTAPSVPRFAA